MQPVRSYDTGCSETFEKGLGSWPKMREAGADSYSHTMTINNLGRREPLEVVEHEV